MTNLIDKLRRMIRMNSKPKRPTTFLSGSNTITLTDTAVEDLMRQVNKTQENQYSCEETFALLDEYVELVTSEEDAVTLMPLVERHIHFCPDCREHYDTLLTILQTE